MMNQKRSPVKSVATLSFFFRISYGAFLATFCGFAIGQPIYEQISVCHGFGCSISSTISLSDREWKSVVGWLEKVAPDAKTERDNIRQAIGWMEVIVGRHGPGRQDKGLDLQYANTKIGQMDCIDESTNTTTYLRLFEKASLLHWHQVIDNIQRRGLIDAHWAGQIEEISTGERYVVDSWFHDNGMLPNIQKTKEWSEVHLFSAQWDNSKN